MKGTRQSWGVRIAAAAALALSAAGPAGGDAGGGAPVGRLSIDDPATGRVRRQVHDVRNVEVEAVGGELRFRVRFARPLLEGMFECVHAYLDLDDDPKTGRDGAEMWLRAGVGSRFRPTAAPEAPGGVPAAFSLRKASWSEPYVSRDRTGRESRTWMNRGMLEPPEVEGEHLRFRVPLDLLKDHGLRYNDAIGLRFDVEGTCSEPPVSVEYRCADDGVPVVVDGRDAEWSGGPRREDATGELHADASEADLVDLQVEHGPAHVFARVRLARPGLESSDDDDVQDLDAVHVHFLPLQGGGQYMERREVVAGAWLASDGTWALGDRVVEFGVPRPAEQTAFRVLAWTDAERHDLVPDRGSVRLRIPPSAWRRP